MMYNVLFILLFVSFVIRIVANTLFAVWFWQIKEYRWDRLWVHLKETREGKRFLLNRNTVLLTFLFLAAPLATLTMFKTWYLVLATIVFAFLAKKIVWEIQKRMLRRPSLTAKALLLIFITFAAVLILLLISPFGWVATLVIIDRLLFPLISSLVVILAVPTGFIKLLLMLLAVRKRLKIKNLIVIGVTGSYGKSSTKDLIANFLSEKYNVLKTPGSVNTDLGIVLFVLKNLKQAHEVFVVEIGAYKKGEIAAVCNFVKPTIGVLTGINEQHLSLFGSLEKTKRAKFELIESLPEDGMAFFNADDKTSLAMAKWAKLKNTFVYSMTDLPDPKNAKINPFFSNVAAAYLLAKKLGVSEKKLEDKLGKVLSSLGLKTIRKGNVTILDDSFNANPKGFAAALDVLANQKGKKILVTPGIIELGSESGRIHRELGEKIGTICDVVILTNDNFEEPIRGGLTKSKFIMSKLLVPKRDALVSVIKGQLQGKTTVLLEGRMPSEITNQLINQSTN